MQLSFVCNYTFPCRLAMSLLLLLTIGNRALPLMAQNADIEINNAKQLLQKQLFKEALSALETADSSRSETWYYRAQAHYATGQFGQALRSLDRAIDINPVDAASYSLRGMVKLYALQKPEDAVLDFSMATGINPNDSNAFAGRSFAWLSLGNTQKALADCNKALRIAPHFPEAWYLRGAVYMMLDSSYTAILNEFDRTLALNPKHEDALLNSCILEGYLNNHQKALVHIETLISVNSSVPRYHVAKANVLRNLKQYDEALSSCRNAIAIDSLSNDAYLLMGAVYFDQKHFTEAIEAYTRCIELIGNEQPGFNTNAANLKEAHYFRGLSKINNGDKSAGCNDLRKAMELGDEEANDKIKENCQ